jgi:superfamily II DNA or RNA helicase
MPAYRFSWDSFDDATVRALAEGYGFEGPPAHGDARRYLTYRVKRPTPDFVGDNKDVLARVWVPQYAGAAQLVARLIDEGVGPMSRPRTPAGYRDYIESTRNSKTLRRVLCDAMIRFGDADRSDADVDDGSFVPRFAVLERSAQEADRRTPHDYQKEAWNRLSAHLAEAASSGAFQGLVVMPTGAGKTFTAVRWLLQNVVARGQRVLWLAHRYELLNQAAAEVHKLAAYAGLDRMRVRIVSGQHCATTTIDPSDNFVLASVQSLARRPEIRDELLADPKLFLVVDEAHHAPAKSYRDVISQLVRTKRFRVLGLTATPTRTIEDERSVLSALFGRRVLFQIDPKVLVERGILSRPRIVQVKTEADVEAGVTPSDKEHLAQFSELSEEWLARIAHLSARNQLIVQHYLEHRAKYGKTLIFAINVAHAALLAEQLRARDVRADYVASYRPDGTDGEPRDVIARFRDGDLDVLINVQMMTEGVDVPDIHTAFLTRPTASEILMRQMIGRALRGPAAGGTAEAYLVSFEDHWEQYQDWASPFALVPDVVGTSDEDAPRSRALENATEYLPWDLIRSAAQAILSQGLDAKADAFEAVPHGWYVLERETAEEGTRHIISVYEHQKPSWEALLVELAARKPTSLEVGIIGSLYDNYFGDCDTPRASEHDVLATVAHFIAGGTRPAFNDLERRRECDPSAVAKEIFDADMGERSRAPFIEQRYTPLAKAIYPNLREYRAAIEDALYELHHPDEATHVPRAVPVFAPTNDQRLRPGPTHDLDGLLREVLAKGRELLGVDGVLPRSGRIEWSKRIVKGWYGRAYFEESAGPGDGLIRVNRLLDSPDVSADTMRMLLWHEYLHMLLRQGHTKDFRERERRWPGIIAADRELDTLNERFGVQYW